MNAPDQRRPPSASADLIALGWESAAEDGFIGLVGPFWSRFDGDRQLFGFVAEPRHANLVGVVQGGMLMTFADRGLGIVALAAAGRSCVTTSFEMQFVGAGRIGSFIELEGEVVQLTRSMIFMRGLLRSGKRLVGSCQGSWKLLSERRTDASPEQAA